MFGTVLLAVDPTHEESWEIALPRAVEIVRASSGTLHLLAVVPDFGVTMVASYFPPGFEKEALDRALEDLQAFAEKHVPEDVRREVHVGHGHVPEQVLAAADRTGAELIVMASHPPDRLRTFLVGSYADKVVHRAHVSVLVVRGPDL